MANQFSVAVRNGRADSVETTIGASPILRIRTGAQPANAAAADSGTVLATVPVPADWLAAAAAGAKAALSLPWQELAADAPGVAAHFRLYDSGGSTCHWQGSVSITAGGGDMQLDNTTFVAGQPFNITGWSWIEGNA